jgi:16S rRNA (adenine1518-N6/adenine1519-N6)-dimethyltransferase
MLSCDGDTLPSLEVVPQSRRPKLGQHFLANLQYRARIVEALDLHPEDTVIEIGAGIGALTEILAKRVNRVVAVELDSSLAAKLREKVGKDVRIEILQADILRTNLAQVCQVYGIQQCFVCGNLPYYVTSPILHHVFGFSTWIRGMGFLVQREVAKRIIAAPGTRDYGYLSVIAQLYSRPRLALNVPPGAFAPAPKVHSSLVVFDMTPRFSNWSEQQIELFLSFVKGCFAKKRKSLMNNLVKKVRRDSIEAGLRALGFSPSIRAEQMNIEQLANLFQRLAHSPQPRLPQLREDGEQTGSGMCIHGRCRSIC